MISKTRDYLVVKIPLSVTEEDEEFGVSSRLPPALDKAIQEGLADIEAGRFVGPFSNVKKFRASLAGSH